MADTKVSALPSILASGLAAGDLFLVIDVSANAGKNITKSQIDTLYVGANVMTAAGDMLIGGVSGAATRLAKGSDGQILQLTSGSPAWNPLSVAESNLSLTDITTGNASTSKHGLLPKLSNTASQFLNGQGSFVAVSDANLSVTDITTNNATTSAHGFLPKLNGSISQFLNGNGAWATPSGGGGGSPGGSDTQLQFNDGGSAFGGAAGLNWDKTASTFNIRVNTDFNLFFQYDAGTTSIYVNAYSDDHSAFCDYYFRASEITFQAFGAFAINSNTSDVTFSARSVIVNCPLAHTGNSLGFFSATAVSQQVANDALTDSTGGTPSTTLAAVSGTLDDADINNNFASLAAQLAKIRTLLTNYGLGS